MRHISLILTVLLVSAACTPPTSTAPVSPVVRYSSDAKFDTVRDDVQNAILAKGLVIDQTSYIAKMLDRTRKDVGGSMVIFADGRGQAFSFCSAVHSRNAMQADPHNIAFCPYTIVVYSTTAEPRKVHVAYRASALNGGSEASRAALREVDALLDGIVREALRLKVEQK